eukprot:2796725-Pleurochrysis_carterae.AAC.1
MHFDPIFEPVAIASSAAAHVNPMYHLLPLAPGKFLSVLPTLIVKMSARAACAILQAESSPLRLEAAQVPAAYLS